MHVYWLAVGDVLTEQLLKKNEQADQIVGSATQDTGESLASSNEAKVLMRGRGQANKTNADRQKIKSHHLLLSVL